MVRPQGNSRWWLCAMACAVALVTASCLDVEQSIVLNRDLSGKVGMKMAIDMEPFMQQTLNVMSARSGAPPPPDVLEQVKQGMSASLGSGVYDIEASKKILPAGVTIVDAVQKIDNWTLTVNLTFAFTDIHKLTEIGLIRVLRPGSTATSAPQKVLSDLEIRDEGDSLVIKTRTVESKPDATPEQKAQAEGLVNSLMGELNQPGMTDMMKDMTTGMQDAIKKMHVAFKIDTPLTVTEHNATSKTGTVLLWEQKFDQLDVTAGKMPDMKPLTISVKLKKS